MEQLSIFDIFKIGVGPSSSHTLGPWKAALLFRDSLAKFSFDRIEILLYGSLSKTGKGHKTDVAVQLGLSGLIPETSNSVEMNRILEQIKIKKTLVFNRLKIPFDTAKDIVFCNTLHQAHPNMLTFRATQMGSPILEHTFCSIGGGFIHRLGESQVFEEEVLLPFPIQKGADLLSHVKKKISQFGKLFCKTKSILDLKMKSIKTFQEYLKP